MIRFIKSFLLVLASVLIWLVVQQYLFCPVFDFAPGEPFSGAQWYNPYERVDSGRWIKCNFHAHTRVWGGLTNGRGSAAEVWRAYGSEGYTVHAVSNYQRISADFKDSVRYMPVYEHGYNIRKTHQVVVGDSGVIWLDYVFPQTRSNKQDILNRIAANGSDVIILAHPVLRKGYLVEDMRKLVNYDCIEILNPQGKSISQWDAALSSGNAVFAVGNDDMHDVSKPWEIGQFCTWLSVPVVNREHIQQALKLGQGYAMVIGHDTAGFRGGHRGNLPGLRSLSVIHDTLRVTMTEPASMLKFVGQEGRLLASVQDTSMAAYPLRPSDTYVRVWAGFADGTEIFLNPVFRSAGAAIKARPVPVVNAWKSRILFLAGIIILAAWVLFIVKRYIL